ncbi:TraB/GumN family protein [Undibacterium sp. Ji42W]|uniref:TraB/GumN family protein n=1 Tax=Undibacterium sp. Ji42W TaxID=3413039 RepID=UPI003BF06507
MKRINFDLKILFFFFLQLLFVTLPIYASGEEKPTQVQTFYIKVSGHGNSFSVAPSMHSSLHILFPHYYAFAIKEQISKAKGLCLEVDAVAGKEDMLSGKYAQKMLVNDDYNIQRYLDNGEKLQILASNAKIPPQLLSQYIAHATPFNLQQAALIGALTDSSNEKNKSPSLDIQFEEFAKVVKVPIHYLESSSEGAEQIISTFSDIKGWQTSLLRLADFLECEECKKKHIQRGLSMEEAIFLRGDFKQAKSDYDELGKLTGADKPAGVAIGDKRTVYLLEKIVKRANANECSVFAIGAAHFFGAHSLQEEFKKRGYNVEMVNVVRE